MVKKKELITRVEMFPKDANADGSIFGGVIVSHIDIAGAIAARAYMQEHGGKSQTQSVQSSLRSNSQFASRSVQSSLRSDSQFALRIVTKIMREIDFVAPVFVGDTVAFYARIIKVGKTSITVQVEVVAERVEGGEEVKVTEAEIVYVAVGEDNLPTPIKKV